MRNGSWVLVLATLACAGYGSSEPPPEVGQAAAPTFSPPGGAYGSAQQVTVSSATPGATVRCTQDGSAPDADSPACSSVEVAQTTTLRAIAFAPGLTVSESASATYSIEQHAPAAEPPTFAPPGGTYTSAQQVTVSSATAGAVVRCTLDGSLPTLATPACATPMTISATTTIR